MAEAAVREFSGTIVRGTIEWIEKAGLTERVRKEVPSDTAALIARPPLPIGWLDARHMDQLLTAVERVAGPDAVVTYGVEATRRSFGPVLSPVLRGMVGMFGATPATLFTRLDRICSLMIRGATYPYEALSATEGVLTLRSVDRAAQAWFRSWNGVLAYAFEITQTKGSVKTWQPSPRGNEATYHLTWTNTREEK